jgi:hypothetical protein
VDVTASSSTSGRGGSRPWPSSVRETEETSDGVVVFVQLPVTGPRVLEVEEL